MKIKAVFYSGHTGKDEAVCAMTQSKSSHLMSSYFNNQVCKYASFWYDQSKEVVWPLFHKV